MAPQMAARHASAPPFMSSETPAESRFAFSAGLVAAPTPEDRARSAVRLATNVATPATTVARDIVTTTGQRRRPHAMSVATTPATAAPDEYVRIVTNVDILLPGQRYCRSRAGAQGSDAEPYRVVAPDRILWPPHHASLRI